MDIPRAKKKRHTNTENLITAIAHAGDPDIKFLNRAAKIQETKRRLEVSNFNCIHNRKARQGVTLINFSITQLPNQAYIKRLWSGKKKIGEGCAQIKGD